MVPGIMNTMRQEAWNFPGLLVLTVICVAGFVLPAQAQSVSELQNRIQRLENDIQTLNRAVYRGEAPPPGSISGGVPNADTQIRLQQMETEIRQMRGKIEELSFENRQLRGELQRVTGDLKLQMQDMQAGSSAGVGGGVSSVPHTPDALAGSSGGPSGSGNSYQWNSGNAAESGAGVTGAGGQLGQITQSASGAVNPTADAAATAYDNAYASLKNKNYGRAQSQFESFLKSYPNHALAGNAKYWLGESHYVRGQFEEAARIFAEGYQQFPNGSKTPDNLLKLGMSLGALGKTQDGCIALGQLAKENLPGSAPVMRRAEQEKARLGC